MAINPNILVDGTGAYTANGQILADLTTEAWEVTASWNLSVIEFGLAWIQNNFALFLLIVFLWGLLAYVGAKKRRIMQG
jgi:hypothetical protein